MMQEWQCRFPAGMVLPQEWEYKDKDPGVDIVVDERALSYSLHKTGRGGKTVDTVLDRVVFGSPLHPLTCTDATSSTRPAGEGTESVDWTSLSVVTE